VFVVADRRTVCRDVTAATGRRRSVMYAGALPARSWCTNRHTVCTECDLWPVASGARSPPDCFPGERGSSQVLSQVNLGQLGCFPVESGSAGLFPR